MNVLIICPHLKIGGVPRYVINLAKGLKAKQSKVTVATFGGIWEQELIDDNIAVLKIPLNTKSILSFKILKSVRIINRFLKDNNIDIIHANTRVAQIVSFLVSKINRKIKTISTYHGYYKAHFFRKLFKFEGDSVISISQEIKRHIKDDLNIPSDKISVVYNGINTNEYKIDSSREELRKKYDISGEPVIGIVARLVQEKNHLFLLKAFKLLLNKKPYAKLVIFGKGRLREELVQFTNDNKISDRVMFISEGEVKEVFKTFDVAVLPSTHEGFGFTVIEAQALQIPVIGSAIGGIKEVISDNETGLLFNKFDESLLCDKITEIIDNPSDTSELVKNAEIKVKTLFSLDKMTEDTLNVYKRILQS